MYAHLGELIVQLIRALLVTKRWRRVSSAQAYVAERTNFSEATVFHWRQGRSRPAEQTLEVLARLGHDEANLSREWGLELLQAGRHPEAAALVNEIWGPQQIREIPNNLRPPQYSAFIGRQAELERLLDLLSPARGTNLISVDGIGGVGKTTLVLEAAYRCLCASTGETPHPGVPTFGAIVFTSARQQFLIPGGIRTLRRAQRTLQDIFRTIASTLSWPDINQTVPEEQPDRVYEALSRQRTLLIVDNLETMQDQQEVLAFLHELPPQVKAVITTREQALYSPIRLGQLSEAESLSLLAKEAAEKQLPLNPDAVLALYRQIGGVPAALVYAVGQLAVGHSLERVLARVVQPDGDVARFYFVGSVEPLRGKPAHQILMALAMFPKPALREALAYVADLAQDPIALDEGLVRLQELSLVQQEEGRCSMLPLTREYALAELAANPDFEREAREQWVAWYGDFTREYGGREWAEWHIHYDRLEEEWDNILAVLDWCASHDRYADIRAFWHKDRLDSFSSIYGHWNDRFIWMDWLIPAAERRGDWPTVVQALADSGWTLAMAGQPAQLKAAENLLTRAWILREQADANTKANTARNTAVFHIRCKQYADAHHWLDLSLAELAGAGLAEREYLRLWLEVPYFKGIICFATGDYDQAETLFRQMLAAAQSIGWQRAVIYGQNWLADIALKRGALHDAERLIQTGLPVAERNNDKRRTPFYQRSFALLEQARRNPAAARRWAKDALDGFERLGMHPEAEEMCQLLAELEAE